MKKKAKVKSKKKDPESHWNYRVMVSKVIGELIFTINEVYYTGGKPDGYIINKEMQADSPESLKWSLSKMVQAAEKPILWTGKSFPKEYKPKK